MKILIVSDVHGNFHALDAVVKKVPHHVLICCGDLVVDYPFPGECIRTVKAVCTHVCRGNNDDLVARNKKASDYLSERYANYAAAIDRATELTQRAINDEDRQYLAGLPRECRFTIRGISFYMNHTGPGLALNHYLDLDVPASELHRHYENIRANVILTGHTHIPYIKQVNGRILVNPGSIGEPRDGDPRASYATFDTVNGQIALGRLAYDITETLRRLDALSYPNYSRYCLENGVLPENPEGR